MRVYHERNEQNTKQDIFSLSNTMYRKRRGLWP